ncbi:MAG: hypothetical protein Q4C61_00975 [Lachnospiraceae bacterium]|nr:hypothetical protein [Lachnospiraceae bacterium]
MSQAKVDRYKEEKRNRAKIIKKEKRQWMATKAGLSLVALVLVVWAGVSVYNGINAPDSSQIEKPTYTVDTSAVDDFLSDMSVEE